MINFNDELRSLFYFKREISQGYAFLEESFAKVKTQTSNVVLRDGSGHYPDSEVTVSSLSEGKNGYVLIDYYYGNVLEKEGPVISHRDLPATLSKLKDCPYVYHGLRLNIWAFMLSKRIGEMRIIASANNCESTSIIYRPYIAADLLSFLYKRHQNRIKQLTPKPAPAKFIHNQQVLI